MSDSVSIAGLDKAAVLAALYNASRPLGMGFMDPRCKDQMNVEQAQSHLDKGAYFDYLQGRVMKISLCTYTLDTFAYNRDNGPNAAERVIEQLRAKGDQA